MKKKKKTILILTREELSGGVVKKTAEIVGSAPTEDMAKDGIQVLLKYVKKIYEIR